MRVWWQKIRTGEELKVILSTQKFSWGLTFEFHNSVWIVTQQSKTSDECDLNLLPASHYKRRHWLSGSSPQEVPTLSSLMYFLNVVIGDDALYSAYLFFYRKEQRTANYGVMNVPAEWNGTIENITPAKQSFNCAEIDTPLPNIN